MTTSLRQNRPGTAKKDLYAWSPQDMDDMNTTLVCHQYIQQLIRSNCSDVEKIVTCPDDQDPDVWQYEHIRQTCMELNGLVLALEPGCTKEKFPTMYTKTPEMQFLCAVYNPPRATDAMTYIVNTLDHTIGQLCSEKMFPSRVNIPEASVKKFASICRRVYRIFAHAFFQHREVFDKFEADTNLCRRFHAFVVKFDLMRERDLEVDGL